MNENHAHQAHTDQPQHALIPDGRPTRGLRPLFSRVVVLEGQRGVFIPLLGKKDRSVIEEWLTAPPDDVDSAA